MNGREQESILWWFLYSQNLTGMILFPPFKVWCHFPHFTDEETDWKAQNHISCSVEDLWYLIKSLEFPNMYFFPLDKLFSKCGSRTTVDQDPFKGSMRPLTFLLNIGLWPNCLLIFQPKSNVLSEWMQKQIKEPSYLLISQTLRRFAKM